MNLHRVEIDGADVAFECGEDERLLAAIERAGWPLPTSCRAGVCGTREGQVLSGSFVLPGRQGPGPVHAGPAESVRLCHVQPRSALLLRPRWVGRLDHSSTRNLRAKVLRIDRPASDVAVLRNDGVELHVRRQPGGAFSELAFERLQADDFVDVRLAFGDFWLRQDGGPRIFLAGGTGFAPVQSMVEELLRSGAQDNVHIYVGARAPGDMYGQAVLRRWAAARPGWRIAAVVSDPACASDWPGRRGFVHEAVLQDFVRLDGHTVYACGPPAMVAAARTAFAERGLAPERFHCDALAPSGEMG